ncbi:hypothetical protein [Arthrobacter alpinus]|uniref:hypothetical protein n=1 Tax=Arthrobacter alpinus TaxID=656366 RepID=UPI00101ADAD0|nr:hypothetical protein [Arthrobacter alpinus]
MSPSPAPVAVTLDPVPAQWWEILGALGPLAILLGAIVAAVIGGFTLRQRTQADALALAQSANPMRMPLNKNAAQTKEANGGRAHNGHWTARLTTTHPPRLWGLPPLMSWGVARWRAPRS